jgi:hypothetical protein
MASEIRRGIIRVSSALMILILGVAAHEVWLRTALRNRPWQFESYVDNMSARCAADAEASAFAEDLRALAGQREEARLCLDSEGKRWVVGRDYDSCFQKLAVCALAAIQVRRTQEQRVRDREMRLTVTLKALESELDSDARARRAGTKLEIRNLAQSQARTLIEAARNLIALGQTGSALVAAMRARAAWDRSENSISADLSRFYDSGNQTQWEKTAQDLLRWTSRTGRTAILVDKLEHLCLLLAEGRVERAYVANLGRNWYREKSQEHDASTPEGDYRITKKFRSGSFGWALLLDYPNAADRQRFNALKKMGAIPARARIGGNIEIHGGGRHNSDWTDGCVSLGDPEMADLYKRAYTGMRVTIVGTSSLGASVKE